MDSGFDYSSIEAFEWDEGNLDHIKRHNVEAKECEEVFFNKPLIISRDELHSHDEERHRVYGHTNKDRKITLIFTIRKHVFRVISARDQSKRERREYIQTGGERI